MDLLVLSLVMLMEFELAEKVQMTAEVMVTMTVETSELARVWLKERR